MKFRISDSLLRAQSRPDVAIEIYDTVEPGLVARLRPSGHVSFWLYEDRGRKKTKLGMWPQLGTKLARTRCRDERTRERNAVTIPTLEAFLTETYIPAYALDHRNLKHLSNLVRFRREFGDMELVEFTEQLIEDWRAQLIREGIQAEQHQSLRIGAEGGAFICAPATCHPRSPVEIFAKAEG